MSQTNITYQHVADACEALAQQGQKLTVRSIHQHTGGSFSTIATFFRQWQEQRATMDEANHPLSSGLTQALFNEFKAIQKKVQARFNQQIQQLREVNKESEILLADYEKQLQEQQQQLAQEHEKYQAMHIECEKQQATLTASKQHARECITQLESKLEQVSQACQQHEIQAAVHQARYESIKMIQENQRRTETVK